MATFGGFFETVKERNVPLSLISVTFWKFGQS